MDNEKLGRIDEILIELIEYVSEEDRKIAGEARGLIYELSNSSNVIHDVVCSTRNTPAYVLDNIKFELNGDEFLIFMIAHKGISTKGQILYNGEAGYVIIKNGKTMMREQFDEALVNTLLRWNLIPRK